MKLIVQRVSEASVTVDGVVKGAIGGGYMVLVGCRFDDSRRDADYLARRLAGLRVFNDAEGKMNLSIEQTGGSVLLVSQFTLYADTRKGNRPGFTMGGIRPRQRSFTDILSGKCARFSAQTRWPAANSALK